MLKLLNGVQNHSPSFYKATKLIVLNKKQIDFSLRSKRQTSKHTESEKSKHTLKCFVTSSRARGLNTCSIFCLDRYIIDAPSSDLFRGLLHNSQNSRALCFLEKGGIGTGKSLLDFKYFGTVIIV